MLLGGIILLAGGPATGGAVVFLRYSAVRASAATRPAEYEFNPATGDWAIGPANNSRLCFNAAPLYDPARLPGVAFPPSQWLTLTESQFGEIGNVEELLSGLHMPPGKGLTPAAQSKLLTDAVWILRRTGKSGPLFYYCEEVRRTVHNSTGTLTAAQLPSRLELWRLTYLRARDSR